MVFVAFVFVNVLNERLMRFQNIEKSNEEIEIFLLIWKD